MSEREPLADALETALAALERGASLESALAEQPALAAELRPLLLAARAAGAGDNPARVPAGAQISSRAQFLAQAANQHPAVVPVGLSGWSRLRAWLSRRSPAGGSALTRAVVTGLVVLTGLGAGGFGAVAASAQSLPGDPLYTVKRTVENTQLLLASDARAREQLQTEFDNRRVGEVQALVTEHRQAAVDFTGTLISRNGPQSQHWIVSAVAVFVGPPASVDGVPALGARVRIQGLVGAGGEVQALQVTVLAEHAVAPTPTTTASPSPSPEQPPATPTDAATPTAIVAPTQVPLALATLAPTATSSTTAAVDQASPSPSATSQPGGGGPSPSNTPKPTQAGGGGPSPSNTPRPTDDGGGGGSPSKTPKATDDGGGDGGGSSGTPRPTDDGGGDGGGSSGTPKATDDGGGGGTSPARTPRPTENDGGGGGGGSGASPSNTPKPDD